MNVPRVLGVVLAGGQSSRMGRCKADLPHPSGGTLVDHSIAELGRCCESVAVSINPRQLNLANRLPRHINVLMDQADQLGPAEGVLRSLEKAIAQKCAGVLVVPVDLPFMVAHELIALVGYFEEQPDQIVCGASEQAPDRIEPLVSIYPTTLIGEIERLLSSEDRSLYRFVQRQAHILVRMSSRSLTNINHPEDWPSNDVRL